MNAGIMLAEEKELIDEYVDESEQFFDEFKAVTEALRSGNVYFNRETSTRSGGGPVKTIGIATDERGYLAGRIERPGNQFYVIALEREKNRIMYQQSPRLIDYGDLPDPEITHRHRGAFYYDILREVSPAPDEDITAFYHDFTPYDD
ncbi:MAG: hypothetical protein MUP66_01445 [Candidatus Nanohaloarchaeota archaeon QJJ-5]|nr:hypothetical protein [Candidatus Nanohaloarchaeota archaeon QJJ-5]